jgi:hypothetical protein
MGKLAHTAPSVGMVGRARQRCRPMLLCTGASRAFFAAMHFLLQGSWSGFCGVFIIDFKMLTGFV